MRTTTLATIVAGAALCAACTGGDSTVAKTPTNTVRPPVSSPSGSTPAATTAPPAPTADCSVNLKDPAVKAAIASLPPAPNTTARWDPVPSAGNYNKCAPLSAVIVATRGTGPQPATRAVFFHVGNMISQGVPDTYGYNAIDLSASTSDTVVLNFSNGIPGMESVVSFRWNGTGVEKVQPVQRQPPPG